jgi:hypothetical protein
LKRARKNLEKRLALEAELVPCPQCQWINGDSIAGYRRGRYRGLGTAAAWVGFGGVLLAVIIGDDPVPARVLARKGGDTWITTNITISVNCALGLLLLRSGLRCLIRPNRDHPLPPKLPRNSPPALVEDPETGTLTPAFLKHPPRDGGDDLAELWAGDDTINFRIGGDQLPWRCCQCLETPEAKATHQRDPLPGLSILFPYCGRCARSWFWRWFAIAAGPVVVAAAAAAIAVRLVQLSAPGSTTAQLCILAILLCIGTPFISSAIAYRLTAPALVRSVDKTRGIARLWFRNGKYRDLYANEARV